MTISFDCPWCGDQVTADVTAAAVRCEACAVQVDLADPRPLPAQLPIAAAA
jgi:uncharacterized protein (DUF983 family)